MEFRKIKGHSGQKKELNNDSTGKSYFFCKHYYMFNYIFDIINYIIYGEDGYQESSCFE